MGRRRLATNGVGDSRCRSFARHVSSGRGHGLFGLADGTLLLLGGRQLRGDTSDEVAIDGIADNRSCDRFGYE